MYIYIAGPMRGYPLCNFPAFHKAAHELSQHGHQVFSPAEYDEDRGFDPATGRYVDGSEFPLREVLAVDLSWICRRAETVVVLDGWERSAGALAEIHVAWAVGIPVYELAEFLYFHPKQEIMPYEVHYDEGFREAGAVPYRDAAGH